jgi:hypothetical protein
MKKLNDIGISGIKRLLTEKGYKIFTDGRPNIVGIRTSSRVNAFCDRVWVFWNDGDEEVVHFYTMTTNPGLVYLKKPLAGTKGAAILVPGQYINTWELGMHRDRHLALVQTGGPVKVYRDNNKNAVYDKDPRTIESGYFGINLHHASADDYETVDSYSAGCQVWRYHQPHQDLMNDFKALAAKYRFRWFSYTLVDLGEL